MRMPVVYLSPASMLAAFEKAGIPPGHLCTYCIGGAYPFPDQVAGAAAKATAQLELLEIRQG
tara:strand:- start:497 stop:682 length:186 start_codon:yes stop_codon:yes gene_type:complete